MHLAEVAKIQVVPHTLVRFADGKLCYLTRRVDRTSKGEKIPMEDLCQLSEKLTEHKYKGSHEQIAKLILKYSSAPKLDLTRFWEVVIFSWVTGNSDMHLKNFSLLSLSHGLHQLAPAYDLLNVHLIFDDPEELALTIAGKRTKINRNNFADAMRASGLNDKVIENIFKKFIKVLPQWTAFIDISFLPDEIKEQYKQKIAKNVKKLS